MFLEWRLRKVRATTRKLMLMLTAFFGRKPWAADVAHFGHSLLRTVSGENLNSRDHPSSSCSSSNSSRSSNVSNNSGNVNTHP